MVEQEEKRWLRALLEGEVEPGSEEWEQVCTDSAFTRVREKVGAVARLDFTQQEDEVEGMWRVLVDRRKKGLERRARGRKRLLRWISGTAAVVALGIGGWLSIRGVEREQVVVVGGRTVEGRTELVLPNGERRVLGDDKVRVVSDSCGEMRTENRTLIVELGGQETKKAEYYTLNVPYGEKYSIVLPDGTKVFLNAGTTLRYPDHFEGGSREVYLNGEAYLEVDKGCGTSLCGENGGGGGEGIGDRIQCECLSGRGVGQDNFGRGEGRSGLRRSVVCDGTGNAGGLFEGNG